MTHRLVATHNITLDGRIEFLDPWFDPSPQDQGVTDLQEQMDRQGDACAGMLLGRRTFEEWLPVGAHGRARRCVLLPDRDSSLGSNPWPRTRTT